MTRKKKNNPEHFVREELCQSRVQTITAKLEGLRTEMKALLTSSLVTIVLILIQLCREFLNL